jgi:hypothetical protein
MSILMVLLLILVPMEKIPRSIKHNTILLSDEGHSQEEIKNILGILVATIQHAKHNFKEHGDVEGCPGKVGRRGKLDTYMEQVPGFYSFSNYIDACLDGSSSSLGIFE